MTATKVPFVGSIQKAEQSASFCAMDSVPVPESRPGQKRRRASEAEGPFDVSNTVETTSASPPSAESTSIAVSVARAPRSTPSATATAVALSKSIDYSQPYRPGALLFNSGLLSQAKAIAAELQADFDGATATVHVHTVLGALQLVKERAAAAEELAQRARDAGDDAAFKTATLEAQNCASSLKTMQQKLADALAEQDAAFRRNLREEILRVTLQIDVAEEVDRTAVLANDVHFVQPPRYRCPVCGNTDETKFVSEYRSGDVVCTFSTEKATCGTIVAEHTVYDGDWTRNFEGEESTSQVGPRPNSLMSNSHNLRTGMSLAAGVSKSELRLRQKCQDLIELDQSSHASVLNERLTREGYKDKQKVMVFNLLDQCGARLQIPEKQVIRAKSFFAAFRDAREKVTGLYKVVAACLITSIEEAIWEAEASQLLHEKMGRTGASVEGGQTAHPPRLPLWMGHGQHAQPVASTSGTGFAASSSAPTAAPFSVPSSVPPGAVTGVDLATARQRAVAASRQRAANEKNLQILDVTADDSSGSDSDHDATSDPFTRRTELTRLSLARTGRAGTSVQVAQDSGPSSAAATSGVVSAAEFQAWAGAAEEAAGVNPEILERDEYKAPS